MIYAEINGSMQQFGGTCPAGWVEVLTPRPNGEFIATAEGLWVKIQPTLEELAAEQRELREELLKKSDWIGCWDTPLTDEQKLEWKAYRQALRDIPEQPGFPEFVIVPDPPIGG